MEIAGPSKGYTEVLDVKAKEQDIQKAAGEMEALFIYQLLKVMRKSMSQEESEKGFGRSVHEGLFDWELARELSMKRGIGLKEIIARQLTKDYQNMVNLSHKLPIKRLGVLDQVKGEPEL